MFFFYFFLIISSMKKNCLPIFSFKERFNLSVFSHYTVCPRRTFLTDTCLTQTMLIVIVILYNIFGSPLVFGIPGPFIYGSCCKKTLPNTINPFDHGRFSRPISHRGGGVEGVVHLPWPILKMVSNDSSIYTKPSLNFFWQHFQFWRC